MDIALARTFLMIAETGSFIEAARRMNVTQSTVSSRVRNLEMMLGRQLFERSKVGAQITTASTEVLPKISFSLSTIGTRAISAAFSLAMG